MKRLGETLRTSVRTRLALAGLALAALSAPTAAQLEAVVQETGRISVSVDGKGTVNSSYVVRVNKPAGATVRKAYFAACAQGNPTFPNPPVIGNGEITLNGTPINWSRSVGNNAGTLIDFFWNVFADVTNVVKATIDAAPAGLVNIPVIEAKTDEVDGSILTVIFDDPNVAETSTVIVLFGGQDTTGDQFTINLAEPIDPTEPGVVADMGLGIGFSFQGDFGTGMVSLIDVNSRRMTSSAGGEDDGEQANGALLTVGGIDDSRANPPDPFAGSSGSRTDDELYNLLPFVNPISTAIVVDTLNPSDDDNIYFGYFVLSTPAAIGESILLSPVAANVEINVNHTVTAKVVDDNNNPVVGRRVDFKVTAGPNLGLTGNDNTDANGEATFTWTSAVIGTDTVVATMTDSGGMQQDSNPADVTWQCTPASRTNYGVGHPGTLGVPTLTLDADPVLGTTPNVQVSNSLGTRTHACVFVGTERALVPTPLGGNVLVGPLNQLVVFAINLPDNQIQSFRLPIDNIADNCGRIVTMQVVEIDAGASAGVSFSAGLELTVGR